MKYIISILLLTLTVSLASAQEVYTSSGKSTRNKKHSKKGYDPSKLIIGGGIIAGFADNYVDVGLSPIVGYRFTDHFSAGVGIGYEYVQAPEFLYDQNIGDYKEFTSKSSNIYPSIWARYFVWKNFFVEGNFEYDFVSFKGHDYNNDYNSPDYGNVIATKINVGVPCMLAGVGVKQPLGGRASLYIEILYDVLQQQYSPYYGQPVFRGGIAVGL